MLLIDKSGTRQACDRCHRVNVRFKRGSVCEDCRRKDRELTAQTLALKQFVEAYQRRIMEASA